MKAQRLKITESGMATYSDFFCGIKFTDGLSDEAVAPAVQLQIGSLIRVEGVDDDKQVGASEDFQSRKKNKAPVVVAMADAEPETVSADTADSKPMQSKHTREDLEKIADDFGIQGLRSIAEGYGVKGRGIVELVNEILKAQG